MARALIVGCGCRGRELARALVADGHAVRGTTRDESRVQGIEAAGAEGIVADPDRLATLLPQIEGIGLLYWLMGTATGDPGTVAAIHAERLESFLDALVDTPVRGIAYEAAGTVEPGRLERGADIARRAAATHSIPVEVLTRDPADHAGWLEEARGAAARLLG